VADEKPEKRKAGLQKGRVLVLSLTDLADIERMYLQGVTQVDIAKKYNVTNQAIRHHVEKTFKPRWMQERAATLDEEWAKVDLLYRIAWERFEESKLPQQTIHIEQAAVRAGADPKLVKRSLTRVNKTGDVGWAQVIQWCIEWKSKVGGYYAAEKHKHEHTVDGSIRVAGTTPQEFTQAAFSELLQAIAEREGKRTAPPQQITREM
jgi:hypothetical protein